MKIENVVIENGFVVSGMVTKSCKIRATVTEPQHVIDVTFDLSGVDVNDMIKRSIETWVIRWAQKRRSMGNTWLESHKTDDIKIVDMFTGRTFGNKPIDIDKHIDGMSIDDAKKMLEKLMAKING